MGLRERKFAFLEYFPFDRYEGKRRGKNERQNKIFSWNSGKMGKKKLAGHHGVRTRIDKFIKRRSPFYEDDFGHGEFDSLAASISAAPVSYPVNEDTSKEDTLYL